MGLRHLRETLWATAAAAVTITNGEVTHRSFAQPIEACLSYTSGILSVKALPLRTKLYEW